VPNLARIWDEPFADSSQIPTYIVNNMASEHVKVCLSGDGGDELFSGYNRYTSGLSVWQKAQNLPSFIRHSLAWAASNTPTAALDAFQEQLPMRLRVSRLADRLPKLANVMRVETLSEYYYSLTTQLHNPEYFLSDKDPITETKRIMSVFDDETLEPRRLMMLADQLGYLTDDILTKVDRASMASSLEARVPLLDHRLVEYSWRLPSRMLVREGSSKWALRQILYKHVPQSLIERPKIGFGIPIEAWLKGALRDWAEDLLSDQKLDQHGLFETEKVKFLWDSFLSGKKGLAFQIWPLLIFQSWYDVSIMKN
jgi:asparagine synthase (glutamine-hydrolysing)